VTASPNENYGPPPIQAEGDLTPQQILRQQIIENCQRSDLKPIERAKAFRQYMDEDAIDGQQLAEVLHVSTATVSNALKLLTLDEDTQNAVAGGHLTAKAAINGARTAQPKTRGRKAKPPRPKAYRTKAGRVVVEPKVNRTHVDALREALAAAERDQQPLEKAA
jgi:ParB-like chromosome segregation protein Spo0J